RIIYRVAVTLIQDEKESDLKFIDFSNKESLTNWASDILCKLVYSNNTNVFHSHVKKRFSTYLEHDINSVSSIESKDAHSSFKIAGNTVHLFNAYELLSKYRLIEDLYNAIDDDALYEINKSFKNSISFLKKKKKVGGVF
ncbi:hypothetical protein, partial [Moritella viscosa]|uniref:hypothetical protein n=1 Tax=Moritella viscosa TaxID=80854 RepID=UPI001587A599